MLALPLTGSTPELYHGKYVAGMYGSGEQGVWYEPSLSNGTLFQDAAGTTPVTAVEQPVGLMKDKSGRGNHAKQTTSADRPVFSARYNLLTKTEDFSGWQIARASATTSDVLSPDKINYAKVIVNTVAVGSSFPPYIVFSGSGMSPLNTYTTSCYMKKSLSKYGYLRIDTTSGTATGVSAYFDLEAGNFTGYLNITNATPISATIIDIGDGWYKCTATFTLGAGATGLRSWVGMSNVYDVFYTSGIGTLSIYAWGASLVPANQAHLPYQRVNTATDYDADPVKFPPYLKFNGTNSWMVTNSIDFTGTDKMTVFAGLRKLSDATSAMLVELGTGVVGSLSIRAPQGATAKYGISQTVGASSYLDATTTSNYSSPITNILTGIYNGAGASNTSQLVAKINGVLQSFTYAGTLSSGTYANAPIYIGRRAGNAMPFNGNLYSLIIRGAATDDAHLTHTEKFIAYKTGVTL